MWAILCYLAWLMNDLILKGVKQNNLRDFDLEIPLGKTVIVTGPSGSGKSSLAFDTIYAEGQRRYMQSLSTYARQFLEKFRAPLVDKISNIPPTIALEQLNPVRNSRATVGTSTELYDYLRLLFEKMGIEYCETCDVPMERISVHEMSLKLSERTAGEALLICFEKTLPAQADGGPEFLNDMLRSGYSRFLLGGEVKNVEESSSDKKIYKKTVYFIVDRLRVAGPQDEGFLTRVSEALTRAMDFGGGLAFLFVDKDGKYKEVDTYTNQSRCPKCKKRSIPKSAISFSFNSPLGACENCKGFGNTLELDEDLVVPNPKLSLAQGAIDPFTKPSLRTWQKKLLAFAKSNRIDADVPYKDLPAAQRKLIFSGAKGFRGVQGVFDLLNEEKYKMRIRVFVSRYTSPFTCPKCTGSRLNASALRVKVGEKSIAEVCDMTLTNCETFFKNLKIKPQDKESFAEVLRQIERRLDYLNTVGLGYLTLSRLSRSLSGGEYQRILLATQLSQGLTDTMYVLDEPSIGLHPVDTQRLLLVLNRLRALGNSLLVVEHDPEVIEWGEHVLEMGPGSGTRGGNVVFMGSHERFLLSDSASAYAVKNWREECKKALERNVGAPPTKFITVEGASGNNLKDVDVEIPLDKLVVITGVSGSGKSTLIVDTLFQALSKMFHGKSEKISRFKAISGFEFLSSVELVDQSAIGKSSRSNPITFVKGYDEVRSLFAETREAASKKLTPGHFSFNVPGGRCDVCEGEGRVRVDMVFMEDIWIPCQTCDEKRFKPHVLAVKYKGKSIDDVLRMTVEDAFDFFQGIPSLRAKLALLREVGLGYVQLGQPGYTLSGGEAQRLKIARELTGGSASRSSTLFILDEPTTGLHFNEVSRLITVLRRMVAAGHSVVVIEHNLQLICHADYLIDLGPDGGEQGGNVVAMGTPKEVALRNLPNTSRYLFEILSK